MLVYLQVCLSIRPLVLSTELLDVLDQTYINCRERKPRCKTHLAGKHAVRTPGGICKDRRNM
jgi:hypothetical protein